MVWWWVKIMNWKGFGMRLSFPNRDTNPHGNEVLRKTTKNLSQDSRCPGIDSNWAFHECESRTLHILQPVYCDSVWSGIYKIFEGLYFSSTLKMEAAGFYENMINKLLPPSSGERILFYREHRCGRLLRNICKYVPDYTPSRPRRQSSQ
jgi:hypothetical protein